MRKEMNSKSKRKWVAGGLAAFASVALLTTGFATWVIGTQNMSSNIDGTTVNVDTATNKSIELSMPIASPKLVFAETTATKPATGKFVQLEGDANGDLTLDFDHIKVTYGSDSNFTPANYKLRFSIVSMTGTNTVSLSTFGRSGADLTYFALPDDIPLSAENGTPTPVSGTANVYTFNSSSVSFKWGTAFGGYSPATFYNDYFDDNPEQKTAANAEIVKTELMAMNAALNGTTINLKAELVSVSA